MSLEETKKSINVNSFSVEMFGLGYVGFPLAVRLAKVGLKVVGIDVNPQRISRLENNELINGKISEEG